MFKQFFSPYNNYRTFLYAQSIYVLTGRACVQGQQMINSREGANNYVVCTSWSGAVLLYCLVQNATSIARFNTNTFSVTCYDFIHSGAVHKAHSPSQTLRKETEARPPSCVLFILSWSFIRINSFLSLLRQLSINMKWIKIGKLTVYLNSVEHEIITNIKEWERFISNKIHIEIIIFV